MVVMFQQLLNRWLAHVFLSVVCFYIPFFMLYDRKKNIVITLSSHFPGTDTGEIERLRSKKKELEEIIDDLEENFKSLQIEQRLLEDEAAKLHKQRVFWNGYKKCPFNCLNNETWVLFLIVCMCTYVHTTGQLNLTEL